MQHKLKWGKGKKTIAYGNWNTPQQQQKTFVVVFAFVLITNTAGWATVSCTLIISQALHATPFNKFKAANQLCSSFNSPGSF